jgi:hypothetical protein
LALPELRLLKLASRGPAEIDEMFEYFQDEIHKRHPGKNRLKVDNDVIPQFHFLTLSKKN